MSLPGCRQHLTTDTKTFTAPFFSTKVAKVPGVFSFEKKTRKERIKQTDRQTDEKANKQQTEQSQNDQSNGLEAATPTTSITLGPTSDIIEDLELQNGGEEPDDTNYKKSLRKSTTSKKI
ncbi:hypothetical protein RUM43_008774 [Polyplax serrata]|uniref:Uncharacterized protein n=1 Tax=Polyplax serrata TaxID=468196 RepID=A0AAN8S1K0_POLSC